MADPAFKNKGSGTSSPAKRTIVAELRVRVEIEVDNSMTKHEARARNGTFTNAGIVDEVVRECDHLVAYESPIFGVKVTGTDIFDSCVVNVK
jgi:hypothetical protein